MATDTSRDLRFAILIDADNIAPKYIKVILDEVANSGVATYKRIYGDWTSQRLASWKTCLLDNSIIPMQQYSYTTGKSATDSAMIIDAMDILYSGTVDGFAIVSSDSDFTRLVARLRESGMQVIGMGEQKTPQPFISACNQFKYLDLLYAAGSVADDEDEEDAASTSRTRRKRAQRGGRRTSDDDVLEPSSASAKRHPGDEGGARGTATSAETVDDEDDAGELAFGEMSRADRRRHLKKIRENIDAIAEKFSDDDGWVSLGLLGDQLGKRLPDFDVRNYGFKKLHPFLKSLGTYEFDEPDVSGGRRQIYLRLIEN